MARKPKAMRAWRDKDDWGVEVWRPCKGQGSNGTIYPDGATVPLPASVRRVLRAAVRMRFVLQEMDGPLSTSLRKAVEAYRVSVAKRRRG